MAILARNRLIGIPIGTNKGNAKDSSVVRGQPVFLDTDGDIDGMATNGVEIIGFADEVSVVDTDLHFQPVYADNEYLLAWEKNTAYAVTDEGKFFGIIVTSGVLSVDLDITNADCVQFMRGGLVDQVAAGTSGHAWFRFIPAVIQNEIENA